MGSKTTEQKEARKLQKEKGIPYTMALRLVRESAKTPEPEMEDKPE
jgi:hypothetical protein